MQSVVQKRITKRTTGIGWGNAWGKSGCISPQLVVISGVNGACVTSHSKGDAHTAFRAFK
jgi:hypothetical protein